MKKNIVFAILGIILGCLLCYFLCCKNDSKKYLQDGGFFKGYVVSPGDIAGGYGIIRVCFDEDCGEAGSLAGVLVKKSDLNYSYTDNRFLKVVYFKINNNNDVQWAESISFDAPENILYPGNTSLKIDLHPINHPQSPTHNRIHIKTKVNVSSQFANPSQAVFEYGGIDSDTGDPVTVYSYDDVVLNAHYFRYKQDSLATVLMEGLNRNHVH